jgi:predicted ATP-grasp superfamily ATP-dependent carboligase
MLSSLRGVRPPAVVLGGVGGSLSVVRSLSRHGVRVHVLADNSSLVSASRHCHEFVNLGSGGNVQDRWRAWLEDRGPRGAVVLPAGDDGLELIARGRAWLEAREYVPIEADDQVLLAMLDKQRTFELATRAGIAAPTTMTVSSAADAAVAAERIGFPCALKPLHSHLFARHFSGKVFVVNDVGELADLIARTSALGLEMAATEIVPGGDDSYCSYYTYIDRDGEPLFHLTKRKLRQYPIHFGLGTYQLTDWSADVAEAGLRFCRGVGLRGLAAVEFKRDARDGSLKLIECNHRFTAANELVRRAGIDVAVLTYEHLLGRRPARMPTYRAGARLWLPLNDLRAVRDYRRAGELTYRDWLATLHYGQRPPFFDWHDPGPTLRSLSRKARRRGRHLLRRSGP